MDDLRTATFLSAVFDIIYQIGLSFSFLFPFFSAFFVRMRHSQRSLIRLLLNMACLDVTGNDLG